LEASKFAMSALAGIVALDGAPIDSEAEASAARAVTAMYGGRAVTRRVAGAAFVQRVASADATLAGETHPLTGTDGRSLFAALARLDNREELAARLGLGGAELARTSDTRLLMSMHERFGDDGVARCLGAFAFARWDVEARRLTLVRDCLGNRALFYHRGPRFVAFATTLRSLLALPGVPRAIDELGLAQFIAVNNREQERTLYRGIERVPGRTLVTIDRNGLQSRKYWSPDFDAPPPYTREVDYIERARELLDIAVAAAMRDTPHVAIATSGGLDSSAIAATAARLGTAASITCFSRVPSPGTQIDVGPFRYLDERDKVEALARMHPSLTVRFITPERDDPFDEHDTRYFARASLPAFGPIGMGIGRQFTDAILAAGHRVVLIGNYGDFGLSWRGPLSLVALLRGGQMSTFAQELRAVARESDRSLARTFAGDVIMPTAPLWMRRLIYRLRGRDPDSVAQYSALNPDFIAETGLARQWREQGFDPWFGPRDWNAARWRTARVFDHNQYASDRRAMADEIAGCEARDPHADRRLLEFALAVPEPMFRRDGVPRSFARRVLADRLPREIIDERRRGANNPTWFRSLNARRASIARDIEGLEASPLARRLLDVPRLKRLMAQWPKDEQAAESRFGEYQLALMRGVHVGRFVRWVEGGNA
jgi:asparagine synthase (glutamine-hydrolysing)